MTAEILQKVGTMIYGVVNVKILDRARRSGYQVVGTCQYNGGTIIVIGKTRSHNADDSLMPVFVKDDRTASCFKPCIRIDHAERFFCDTVVELPARVIQFTDENRKFFGMFPL